MDIIIRTATEKDYSELSRLYDELNKMHVKALPHLFVKPSKTPQDLAYIRGIMKNKDAVLFIAQSGEETIGFIDDICVKNDYRRSSIGEKLMEAVEKWAIDLGLSQIELNVWDFNKSAMAFFADTGYKPLHHIMEKNLNKRLVKSVPRASRK
jgi:ribosomal protein S18 acetylase RimI-like enzyme